MRTSFGTNSAKEEAGHLGHEIVCRIKNCEDALKKLGGFSRPGSQTVVANAVKLLAKRLQILALRQRQYSQTYMSEMKSLPTADEIEENLETVTYESVDCD